MYYREVIQKFFILNTEIVLSNNNSCNIIYCLRVLHVKPYLFFCLNKKSEYKIYLVNSNYL